MEVFPDKSLATKPEEFYQV